MSHNLTLYLKQLIILTNGSQNNMQNSISSSPPPHSQANQMDLFEMLASVLTTIGRGQHILQCIRDVLVIDSSFSPLSLFKYLSKGSSSLYRKHLLAFLDQNCLVTDDRETNQLLHKVFSRFGMQQQITYTTFLKFVYPFNTGILRQISTNRAKAYPDLQKYQKNMRPADSIITGFLLLLQEQITLQKKVQAQLSDSNFPGKDKLRKIIKSIKKASMRLTSTITQNSQHHISMLELKNFMKAFIDIPEHLFLCLGRRLDMEKNGMVLIEKIEIALKKNKKIHGGIEEDPLSDVHVIDIQQEDRPQLNHKYAKENEKEVIEEKQMKEINYREQLYKQLSTSLKVPYNKNFGSKRVTHKTPRSRQKSQAQKDPINLSIQNRKRNISFKQSNQSDDMSDFQVQQSDVHKKEERRKSNSRYAKNRDKDTGENVKNLFKTFIEVFLKGNREVQKCRNKLMNLGGLDYLSIFKGLDSGKGIIDRNDLRLFYTKISAIPTDHDFQILIDRFAQPDEKWISYSQFSQIFKCTGKNQGCQSTKSNELTNQKMHLLSQIIYLILDLETNLRQIIQKLTKTDIEWLFGKINIDSQSKGFINYQELKKYLTEQLEIRISMMDLMSVLKRLDKSKNGVVVKEEFLCF